MNTIFKSYSLTKEHHTVQQDETNLKSNCFAGR
jgi:hypothetical protein